MKLSFILVLSCTLFLPFCKSEKSVECAISIDKLTAPIKNKTLLTSDSNNIREFRDIGQDTVTGGYYTFKNGLLESYYFFTASDTAYVPTAEDDVLLVDNTTNKITFCSYAEYYDKKGYPTKTVGIPLVYRFVNLIGADTICVNAKFYGLNKTYKDIQAKTNTGYVSQLTLSKDTLFTNMKYGCFQFGFGKKEDTRVYIYGSYRQSCSDQWQTFSDTIFLKYKDGRLTKNVKYRFPEIQESVL